MRILLSLASLLILVSVGPSTLSAQEPATLTLTGCLASEDDDGEVEFLLLDAEGLDEEVSGDVELTAGEGVDLAPHVGHTVRITATVADEESEPEDEDESEEDDDEHDLHLMVSQMQHVAASCESGA